MYVLTKEDFEKLNCDDISHKEHGRIIGLIGMRTDYVWKQILKHQGRKFGWWGYDNAREEDETSAGDFDFTRYEEKIGLIGEWSGFDNDNPYAEGFPTRFLWEENFLAEVEKETAEYQRKKEEKKTQAKKTREQAKERKAQMKKQIQAKLTKEELKYIKFK